MESRVKLLGHALHPMLIVFPIGLLVTSLVFDVVRLSTGNWKWAEISFWMVSAGLLGGLAAAVPGLLDLLAIPAGTRARYIGIWHAAANVLGLLLFLVGWLLRHDPAAANTAVVLSALGTPMLLLGGWFGGELVDRLGIGVDDGAHANSPSSLSRRPAAQGARRGRATPPPIPGGSAAGAAE